jgi:lysophospholipid acyltransferase (LPLAT)-like uncharacterized protein
VNELALKGYKIGHIVDGPQGPSEIIKPGLIRIAQVTGKPIIPTITSGQKKWVFNSWDRFMVPKPFSRVLIRFGEAIYIPSELNDDQFEKKRIFVEQKMKALYEDTDLIWANPSRIKEIFKKEQDAR